MSFPQRLLSIAIDREIMITRGSDIEDQKSKSPPHSIKEFIAIIDFSIMF